jgi:hypothetical protein
VTSCLQFRPNPGDGFTGLGARALTASTGLGASTAGLGRQTSLETAPQRAQRGTLTARLVALGVLVGQVLVALGRAGEPSETAGLKQGCRRSITAVITAVITGTITAVITAVITPPPPG